MLKEINRKSCLLTGRENDTIWNLPIEGGANEYYAFLQCNT